MVLRRLALLAALLVPVPLAAQLPPLGMPRGTMRFEVHAALGGADERFRDGTRESLGADLDSDALGADVIPELAEPDARIASLTGIPGYRLSLGRSRGFASNTGGVAAVGLSIGLTDRITLFGRVPIVTLKNRREQRLDPATSGAGANGASPVTGTATGQAAANGFFSSFDAALATLDANIASGAYTDPAQDALARETLASGLQLRDSLRALIVDPATASPFLPLASSAAGAALGQRVSTLQGTLTGSLGIADFTGSVPLPTTAATGTDLTTLALAPTGPYAYTSYAGAKAAGLGDAEVGAVLTLVDSWDRGKLGGVRFAIEGLVRLPTGTAASADDAWPAATGDGQPDVEVNAAADVGRGSLGLRLHGGYVLQLASTFTRRVAAPGTPLVPVAQRADVEINPGDILSIGITPFVRLARPLAAYVNVSYRTRGEDAVSYTGAGVPGVDASLLGQETDWSVVTYAVGLSYAEVGGRAGSRARVPIDATWWWENTATASGGRVASRSVVRMQLRYYVRLW